MLKQDRLLAMLRRSPLWAISEDAIALAIFSFLHPAQEPNAMAFWEAAAPSMRSTAGRTKTAVIPVQGVLTKDGPRWLGSNYDSISDAMENAVNDPDVNRIVLSVDSPGGEVTGLPEAAAIVKAGALVKPVSAVVEGEALSAAYWLTSQARDITVMPSGFVGSVGVRMMHADLSKALENDGVKITELFSGDHKIEWSPFKPLSEDTIANMQARLNLTHQDFINAVAEGRGDRATPESIESRFGEGRTLTAKEAFTNGMVDRIQSPRDFYRALAPAQEETSAPAFPRAHARVTEARRRLETL